MLLEADPEVGYIGSTVELPLVMADGRTVQACVRAVIEATVAAVATLLEAGEHAPSPARESRRDVQLNVRLTAEERMRLEQHARQAGYSTIADFVRIAALQRAS